MASFMCLQRKARFFWILVVIFGFSIAFYMIVSSFQNWSENPATTTIETLKIDKITFPKVSVCPPKRTFLNLNYDIMNSDQKLDESLKKCIDGTITPALTTFYCIKCCNIRSD